MPSTPEEKKKVLTQVRHIWGQIGALERSLEGDAECRAILQQIAAVRSVTDRLMTEALESRIREAFNRSDCYSREASQSVNDATGLVRIYLKWLNLLPY